MRKRNRISPAHLAIAVVCVLSLPPLAWLGYQYVGPRSTGPTQDPVIGFNRAQADVAPNAAHLYEQAAYLFEEPDFEGWKNETGRSDEPLPEELVTWVDAQDAVLDLIRQATQIADCHFPLQRDADGFIDNSSTTSLRSLARFLGIRARLAAERHDAEALADSIAMSNILGRHASQQPTVIDSLIATAILALALDHALVPYAWPELSTDASARYGEQTVALFDPPPCVHGAIEMERDEYCWLVATNIVPVQAAIAPWERVFGEVDRQFALYRELAHQPVEYQLAPDNPILARIRRMEGEPEPSWWEIVVSPVRVSAQAIAPSLSRVFELRIRLIAIQRGCHTVAALFEYRNAHGAFPSSLVEIDGAFKIDPYTAQPFIYRRTDDGFTVYSGGVDRDDDGGKHDVGFGENQRGAYGMPLPPNGDYVFWPLGPAPAVGVRAPATFRRPVRGPDATSVIADRADCHIPRLEERARAAR